MLQARERGRNRSSQCDQSSVDVFVSQGGEALLPGLAVAVDSGCRCFMHMQIPVGVTIIQLLS